MVPHKPWGAQRERASISHVHAREARAKTGAPVDSRTRARMRADLDTRGSVQISSHKLSACANKLT